MGGRSLIVDINGSEKLIDAGEDGLTGQFLGPLCYRPESGSQLAVR
jgi:hypothetical protein